MQLRRLFATYTKICDRTAFRKSVDPDARYTVISVPNISYSPTLQPTVSKKAHQSQPIIRRYNDPSNARLSHLKWVQGKTTALQQQWLESETIVCLRLQTSFSNIKTCIFSVNALDNIAAGKDHYIASHLSVYANILSFDDRKWGKVST